MRLNNAKQRMDIAVEHSRERKKVPQKAENWVALISMDSRKVGCSGLD